MATRIYTEQALPILAITTAVVRKRELFAISFIMENIYAG